MPAVYPFRAIQYQAAMKGQGADVSALIAPPYDVLDAAGKLSLQALSDRNIVSVDLPHLPAKELGPPAAYEGAAKLLAAWLADSTLSQHASPAMFVYRETFTFEGTQHQRTGMTCTLDVRPFGPNPGPGGILPHEETFSGPKEDRMALMKATRTQLSPIFGLHQDAGAKASALLKKVCASRAPDCTARTADGTLHEVWTVADAATQSSYTHALAGEDIYIADGHHRYTTGLNYLKALEDAGSLAADHPARRSMFVIISMSDPGTVIGPTHRVLGGMAEYSMEKFIAAAEGELAFQPVPGGLAELHSALHAPGASAENRLGLWDFASRSGMLCVPSRADPLAAQFLGKPRAWRTLDVAVVQYLIVERICQPKLNAGRPVQWAFPHSVDEVDAIGRGQELGSGGGKGFMPQLAVIVRPTPLQAVREVSQANELMPQKSTFFYPKLATGLFIHPLS